MGRFNPSEQKSKAVSKVKDLRILYRQIKNTSNELGANGKPLAFLDRYSLITKINTKNQSEAGKLHNMFYGSILDKNASNKIEKENHETDVPKARSEFYVAEYQKGFACGEANASDSGIVDHEITIINESGEIIGDGTEKLRFTTTGIYLHLPAVKEDKKANVEGMSEANLEVLPGFGEYACDISPKETQRTFWKENGSAPTTKSDYEKKAEESQKKQEEKNASLAGVPF